MDFVSSLICDSSLSANTSGRRKYPVTRITIHTADRPDMKLDKFKLYYGAEFEKIRDNKNSTIAYLYSQCSIQYGIDIDGKIIQLLDERFRSWASSNEDNDNRAITIEVASDTYHPYAVNSKAYNSLINLLVDICKRNGIKKLVWSTNKKDRINHKNGCNMTVHRDYANKSCPGDYLYNRHGEIAEAVNKKLKVKDETSTPEKPKKVTTPNAIYKVRVGGNWLPEVKNLSDYAGITGKAITDIAIKFSEGTCKYRVHTVNGGWLPYVTGYNTKDHNNGYAGMGSYIDGIEIIYNTPERIKKGLGNLKAKYRVSPVGKGYYPWQYNNQKTNGQDGYAGSFGKKIDRIQLTLSK